jgi:hypothetical protein
MILTGMIDPCDASAADLKFLHQLQQTQLGTSNRKAALAKFAPVRHGVKRPADVALIRCDAAALIS